MSLFTKAIDDYTRQLGENGHTEHSWSTTSIQERICQFNFQCVRTTNDKILQLENVLTCLLVDITTVVDPVEKSTYLNILFKLMAQTRDIDQGKGERDLFYMMVYVWHQFLPEHAFRMISALVYLENEKLPYGSWKDMKRLCNYVNTRTKESSHPIISYCIQLICKQLETDLQYENTDPSKLSLCSRWVPRESSNRGAWLFRKIATTFLPDYIKTAALNTAVEKKAAAKRKTYMVFARMIARLNRKLDTVQIKMCGKTWADIDHHKTTSVTLTKNSKAFMNMSKSKAAKEDPDRIECAENFKNYIESRVKEGKTIKGKNSGLVDLVKSGMDMCCDTDDSIEKKVINGQWDDFMTKVGDLGNFVAMVDQSGSMAGDPYYAAVGLGVAIAQKSALGQRILTFSESPQWVSLDHRVSLEHGVSKEIQLTFTDKMKIIRNNDYHAGFNTNFYRALKLILDSCKKANLPDEIVSNMVLVILSDMQIDAGDRSHNDTIQERITIEYKLAGYSNTPHILFWNLRSTSGFPCVSTNKNSSMLSGFSPVLLNSFCEKGMEVLRDVNPWSILVESLNKPRYNNIVEN